VAGSQPVRIGGGTAATRVQRQCDASRESTVSQSSGESPVISRRIELSVLQAYGKDVTIVIVDGGSRLRAMGHGNTGCR